ncbi:hypothetical protein TRVL_07278 [Trypanosoma vivax]|nr:hypothetical protein TRVL_07278 [Trypanosoma vivax]
MGTRDTDGRDTGVRATPLEPSAQWHGEKTRKKRADGSADERACVGEQPTQAEGHGRLCTGTRTRAEGSDVAQQAARKRHARDAGKGRQCSRRFFGRRRVRFVVGERKGLGPPSVTRKGANADLFILAAKSTGKGR